MKILIVTEDVPATHLGGAGRHAVLLANTLLDAGHHVEMLGRLRPPGVVSNNEFRGKLHTTIDLSRTGWKEKAIGAFLAMRRLHMARCVWTAIKKVGLDWDVIHYHGHLPMLGALVPQQVNFVHTLHDQGAECITKLRFRDGQVCHAREPKACAGCATSRPNVVQRAISAHAVRRYRALACKAFVRHKAIFVSHFLANRFRAVVGNTQSLRSTVVHNFIEPARVRAAVMHQVSDNGGSGHRPMVFMAGRIDRAKGFEAFLEAMPEGLTRKLDIVMCGDGPDLQTLQDRFKESGVRFLGWQSLDVVLAHMACADACVVPSIWEEPCGTTILEGLALGKPVFALARGGTPELSAFATMMSQLRLFEDMPSLVKALENVTFDQSSRPVSELADVRQRLPEILAVYCAPQPARAETL